MALLGLAYKAGTTTLRRSMALEIAARLQKKGMTISFFDPTIKKEDVEKVFSGEFTYGKNIYDALSGAHAAMVITPWEGLLRLNWSNVKKAMCPPRLFFDSRNFLAAKADIIQKHAVTYRGVGR